MSGRRRKGNCNMLLNAWIRQRAPCWLWTNGTLRSAVMCTPTGRQHECAPAWRRGDRNGTAPVCVRNSGGGRDRTAGVIRPQYSRQCTPFSAMRTVCLATVDEACNYAIGSRWRFPCLHEFKPFSFMKKLLQGCTPQAVVCNCLQSVNHIRAGLGQLRRTGTTSQGGTAPGNPAQTTARNSQPPPGLRKVATCSCVRNPGGHVYSEPRPSEEGISCYHVLRPLDRLVVSAMLRHTFRWVGLQNNCLHPGAPLHGLRPVL